jgi:hypothetical protein
MTLCPGFRSPVEESSPGSETLREFFPTVTFSFGKLPTLTASCVREQGPRNIPRTAALPAPNKELTMSNTKRNYPITRKKIPTIGYRVLTR